MSVPLSSSETIVRRSALPAFPSSPGDRRWSEVRDQFLAALDPRQRPAVAAVLSRPHYGGTGLRLWLQALVGQEAAPPALIPPEVIAVYLADSEAVPLHDCADCGLAVPVRPGRHRDFIGEVEHVYFRSCPACGGRTGWYAHLSRVMRREKPRPADSTGAGR